VYKEEEPGHHTLLRLIYAQDLYKTLILVDAGDRAEQLQRYLSKHGISCRAAETVPQEPLQDHEREMQESHRCTVGTFADARSIGLRYDSIIFFGLPDREKLFIEIGQTVLDYSTRPTISLLCSYRDVDIFSSIQEKYQMNTKDEQLPKKEEVLQGQLKSIVKQIKEEENPEVLNSYRKLIKKSVPLFMRGYLAAFLFKTIVEGETPGAVRTGESEMQTIFVSIGKNRKVFPRDLAKLFRSKLRLGPNDIGNIKVLDNYSFIDIPRSRAQEAIDSMDNMDYRGRNITVNFARKKKDKKNNG
jgi:superfamily II DNA/RNA helicase